jgi:tRNA threonylcarbamoyladenosine biosynthesis protein TsaB
MNARLLAFDTSSESMLVAVRRDAELFTWQGPGGAAASATLIPQIQSLMQQAGLAFGQLQAIGFGRGPGAFTGLRTACAVAQGLAFGAALPVVAVDSLLIVAESVRHDAATQGPDAAAGDTHVAMDARMDEVYAGHYRWTGTGWSVLAAPALWTLQALNLAWAASPPRIVTGSALAAFGGRLHTGSAARLDPRGDRPAALMRLAQQGWHDGLGVDAALALPLYLRDKVAMTVAERQAVRSAQAGT